MDKTAKTLQTIDIIGAPMDIGGNIAGARLGPEALRIAGLSQALEKTGHIVNDKGDLWPLQINHGKEGSLAEIGIACQALFEGALSTLQSKSLPVILGGDHALVMASIAAAKAYCNEQNRPLVVLWLDAHSDFNTPLSSPSGNVHGMPLAALTGYFSSEDLLFLTPETLIKPESIQLVGLRSVDELERRALTKSGLNVFDMRTIDEKSIVTVLQDILHKAKADNAHLHVSFDLDFVDPNVAPGVGTPVQGGATYREAHLVMELIHESGLLGSLDLVELNPCLDQSGRSAAAFVEFAASIFGRRTIERTAL